MAINFSNKLISYFLFIITNLILNDINSANIIYKIINQKFFSYITINQYLSNKFYKIMININLS